MQVGSNLIGRKIYIPNLMPSIAPAKTKPTQTFLKAVLGYEPRVESLSHETYLSPCYSAGLQTNMLLMAADACFQEHIPFGLRPEVLWNTILSQVAIEIRLNPETYRSLFTDSSEKKLLSVEKDTLRQGHPEGWNEAIGLFEEPLRGVIPSSIAEICLDRNLSTCGQVENLAHLVTFMDAASPFYSYKVWTLCGIPSIAIFGTLEDWDSLIKGVELLMPLFPALTDYFTDIEPALVSIKDSVAGNLQIDFWRSIFKRNNESGGSTITGWLTKFFAFHQGPNGLYRKQPSRQGYNPDKFPSSVSSVDFIWNYFGTEIPMKLCGGVLSSEMIEGFLTPRLGWGVVHAKD